MVQMKSRPRIGGADAVDDWYGTTVQKLLIQRTGESNGRWTPAVMNAFSLLLLLMLAIIYQ